MLIAVVALSVATVEVRTLVEMGHGAVTTALASVQKHLPGINMDIWESKHTLSDLTKHLRAATQLHLKLE